MQIQLVTGQSRLLPLMMLMMQLDTFVATVVVAAALYQWLGLEWPLDGAF